MIRLSDLKIGINQAVDLHMERQTLRDTILSILDIEERELIGFEIFKQSIDARKKDRIHYVYTVDVNLRDEERILGKSCPKGVTSAPDLSYQWVSSGTEKLNERPVIIGMGPAGLFAGLLLSRSGYRPLLSPRL